MFFLFLDCVVEKIQITWKNFIQWSINQCFLYFHLSSYFEYAQQESCFYFVVGIFTLLLSYVMEFLKLCASYLLNVAYTFPKVVQELLSIIICQGFSLLCILLRSFLYGCFFVSVQHGFIDYETSCWAWNEDGWGYWDSFCGWKSWRSHFWGCPTIKSSNVFSCELEYWGTMQGWEYLENLVCT